MDRHQFRFIVAPEDSVEMDDLRGFTRDLMRQMERDLDTHLDWIAVDHHNTGHPHTHVIVRGVLDDGRIFNIAGDYIAHGIRHRASELVTLELGPQTEIDRQNKLCQEIEAERLTCASDESLMIPALFMSASMGSNAASAWSNNARTTCASETSAWIALARPLAASMAATTSCASAGLDV